MRHLHIKQEGDCFAVYHRANRLRLYGTLAAAEGAVASLSKPGSAVSLLPYGEIQFFLGNVHVGLSYRQAIREIIGKLRNGYRQFRSYDRYERRALLRAVCHFHYKNRDLYWRVMSGNI